MKKILITLFSFCMVCQSIKAQTYHYFPMDSLDTDWYGGGIVTSSHGSSTCAYHLRMYGDTSFDGFHWRKLAFGTDASFAYVREDSSKKVFVTFAIFEGYLTFDFAAQVGNTIPLYKWYEGNAPTYYPSVVTSIDTILVGSTLRKRFSVTSLSYPFDSAFWIEGIGNTRYGLFMGYDCGWVSTLCQVLNSSGLVYNLSCYNSTAVNSIPETTFSINTFPNPVTDILHLETEGFVSKYSLSFIDITGKEIKNFTETKPNMDIDMNGYSAGIYILRITDQSRNSVTTKIVKE